MSSTTDEARDRLRKTIEAYATREGIVTSYVATGVSDEMIEVAATKRENAYAFVSEAIDALVARAREEGAREATMRLKNRLIAVQMTLGDLWNRVDTFDPRMAPDLEEVVKLALEPAP
jgi:DNA-binding Lrp family transcriptional regulator